MKPSVDQSVSTKKRTRTQTLAGKESNDSKCNWNTHFEHATTSRCTSWAVLSLQHAKGISSLPPSEAFLIMKGSSDDGVTSFLLMDGALLIYRVNEYVCA